MKRSSKIRFFCRGAPMLFYPAALPLSSKTLTYTAGLIRGYRRQIGSCWGDELLPPEDLHLVRIVVIHRPNGTAPRPIHHVE